MLTSIEIKSGKHAGELGVIVETKDGIHKVLTLEGDCHFCNDDGEEIKDVNR